MPVARPAARLAAAAACAAALIVLTAPAGAATLAAGEGQSCAVFAGGSLKCWGSNIFGSLGIGDQSVQSTPVPTQVVGLTSGVTDVRLSFTGGGAAATGCAVVNGGVRCWGLNNKNIGNGTSGGGVYAPVTPTGLDAGVTQVSVSTSDSAALQNGVIKGFGDSSAKFGKQSLVPVIVGPAAGGVAEVAVGWRHACFLLATGQVDCVGDNTNGQLGQQPSTTASGVFITGLPGPASRIAAGGDLSCAIVNGGVWCWGANGVGQLGTATTVPRSGVPTLIAGLSSGVTDISLVKDHVCVIKDGAAFCWGANASGQLGDGTKNPTGSSTPVQVKGLTGVTAVAAGRAHSCAIAKGGVWCWGSNQHQQLGNGTADSPVPVLVDGTPATSIGATPLTISAKRQATLGTVACPSSYACRILVPRVTARIGGKAYVLTLLGRRSLKAGQKETLRVSLPKPAFEALKGRSTQLKLSLTVVVAGQKTPVPVKRTLRAR